MAAKDVIRQGTVPGVERAPAWFPALVIVACLVLFAGTAPAWSEPVKEEPPSKGEPAKKKPQAPAEGAGTKPGATAAAPARTGVAPLRFTDDDLEKYRGRPAPADAEDVPGEEATDASEDDAATPGRPASPAPAAPAVSPRKPPKRPAVVAAPKPAEKPVEKPPEDPLKVFREREEQEKFRAQEIERARERIAGIQARLEYLRLRRLRIIDPLGPPIPKAQTEEDKARDASLSVKDLLAAVDEEIRLQEAELAEAQGKLVQIQLRFAQPGGR